MDDRVATESLSATAGDGTDRDTTEDPSALSLFARIKHIKGLSEP